MKSMCICTREELHKEHTTLLRPHGLQTAKLLCSWNSPGKNAGVDCHSLLQGGFSTQGLNMGLLHCRQILYCRLPGNILTNSKYQIFFFCLFIFLNSFLVIIFSSQGRTDSRSAYFILPYSQANNSKLTLHVTFLLFNLNKYLLATYYVSSPGGGHGNLLQYSCLENPMDRRAWRATIHRVTKSQT